MVIINFDKFYNEELLNKNFCLKRSHIWLCTLCFKLVGWIGEEDFGWHANTSIQANWFQFKSDNFFNMLSIKIPTHIMLSETCKDLLRRLLQRNSMNRITFDQFFNHPFVDLDHMASSSSYPKAVSNFYFYFKKSSKKNPFYFKRLNCLRKQWVLMKRILILLRSDIICNRLNISSRPFNVKIDIF